MDPNLAQHIAGQPAGDRHDHTRVGGLDQRHRLGRAHQQRVRVEASTAVPVSMGQAVAPQRAGGDAHAPLHGWVRRVHYLPPNSAMSGTEPHMQNDSGPRELTWLVAGLLFLAIPHAGGVLEHHAVRPFEVQEHSARGRVPAGAEHNAHAPPPQLVPGAHHVVDAGHLVVHVLDARRAWSGTARPCGGPHRCEAGPPRRCGR